MKSLFVGLALKSLICKYPLKQIRATCRKMLQTIKKYILRKMGFKFFCEPCGVKRETMSFWRKQKLQNKIICYIFLKKLKLFTKLVPETVRSAFTIKFIWDHLYVMIWKSIFYSWNIAFMLNYWVICKVNIWVTFYLKMSLVYMICQTYCFSFSSVIEHFTPLGFV